MEYIRQGNRLGSKGLYRAMLSYLVVFLIPFLLVSLIWYDTSTSSINRQVELSAENQLIQAKSAFESQLLQLSEMSNRIPYDSKLTHDMAAHAYYSIDAKNELAKYRMNSNLIDEVYLYYYEEPRKLFSSRGSMTVDTFLDTEMASEKEDRQYFYDQINNTVPMIFRLDHSKKADEQFFGYSVPLSDSEGRLYGTVFYSLKSSYIRNLFQQAVSNTGDNLFLTGENGHILASAHANKMLNSLLNPAKLLNMAEKSEFTFERQTYLVQLMKNETFNLSYIAVTNPKNALASVNHMQYNFVAIFLILLLAGMGAVIILGRRSYQPVQKMESLIREHLDTKIPARMESMADVEKHISDFLNENKALQQEIKLQTPHAREQVLRKLINGRLKQTKEIGALLASVGIALPAGKYFVMIIDSKALNQEKASANQELLVDHFSCVQGKGYRGYASELISAQALALVVSFAEETTQAVVVQTIEDELLQSLGVCPPIGIGSITEALTKINSSYIEGLAALDYRFAMQSSHSVYYHEITRKAINDGFSFPEDKQLKLIQSLNHGDLEIAVETIDWLVENGEGRSLPVQKMYGYYLLNTVARTGGELCGPSFVQKAEKAAEFSNLRELRKHLLQLSAEICRFIQSKPQNQESELKQELFAYIHEQFASSQLSLEALAEQFELSLSYVSRFIKKESGMTFSKYIQELRMEKIKKDLVETNLPIKDIIHNCGYYDVSNYTRKFRTLVGVTPGQYRTLNRTEAN